MGDERRGADDTEALVGETEQLLGDREVDQGRVDVTVTEVGREVGQPALRVDALPVPLEHPMDDEGVAQVVDARATAASFRLEACRADHTAQQLLGGDVRVAALLVAEQMRIGMLRQAGVGPLDQVALQRGYDRGSQRQATRLEELGLANLERTLVEPEVAQLQTNDLAHPQPGAVAEDEHGVER